MKKIKQVTGVVLTLVMALSMILSAMAAPEGELSGGSITIQDAVPGQSYNAYQILYLESYNTSAGAYSYKANSAWESWLRTQTAYVSFDAQGYVTWVEGADAAAFAKLAQAEAAKKTADATKEAPAAEEGKQYSTVTFSNLKLGYYLIDTTLGTLCSLDTTNPTVVMEEKNEVPVNVKKVEEDGSGDYGQENDADIGQLVNFQSTITAQAGAENYVLHDEMSAGLTFGSVTGITLNGAAVGETKYDVVTSGLSDGCTFEVRFTQEFCDTLKANDIVVVSYTAVVNEKAVVGSEGNLNTSKLSYGDAAHLTTTPDSTTKTYTWDIDVFKYTMNESTKQALAGAEFSVSKSQDGKNPIAWIAKGNNAYRVAKAGETGTVTSITTDATGRFTIQGLDSDTYYLTEINAPAGYNKLAGVITVEIDQEGNVKQNGEAVNEIQVLNQTGTELPSTGGTGTTIFYVAGTILILGAAVLLIAKKRMSME